MQPWVVLARPRQRRAQLLIESAHPCPGFIGASRVPVAASLPQRREVVRVSCSDRDLLARCGELFAGEVAHYLRHRESDAVAPVLRSPHERGVNHAHQRVGGIDRRRSRRCARDLVDSAQRRGPGERAQPCEQRPLLRREQVVRPVQRRPQAAVALGPIAVPTRQQRRRSVEPREDVRDVHDGNSGGGQLDRQRHPVQAGHHPLDTGSTGCAWPMRRSCRSSPPGTPTPPAS